MGRAHRPPFLVVGNNATLWQPDTQNRVDNPGAKWSGAPQQIGEVKHSRTTAKVTVRHYWARRLAAAHEWQLGAQIDLGEHRGLMVIPGGERTVWTLNSQTQQPELTQRIRQTPPTPAVQFVTAGAFVADTVRVGGRVTINAGVRFDYSRAISQDMHRLDSLGNDTGAIIDGKGTVGTWNTVSPRVGVIVRLDAAGRTMLRGSYGRFSQGVLTGEISPFHPGQTPVTMIAEPSCTVTTLDPSVDLQLDTDLRMPYTDQYSIGLDREIGAPLAVSAAYIRKASRVFIGWEDFTGQYV